MKTRTILSKVIALINFKNLGYAIDTFSKGAQKFGSAMDSVTREFSGDISKSKKRAKSESKKNQKNIEKLFGSSKSNVKIWSDKKEFKL